MALYASYQGKPGIGRQAYPPIGDYGLLGDCHSWALVCRDGSVDWCNFNTPHRRTVFSRILDWDRGGSCELHLDCEDVDYDRWYVEDTNVLVTRQECEHGAVEITDALTLEAQEGGVGVPPMPHGQLLRRVRCVEGEVSLLLRLSPRFEYGTVLPRVRVEDQHHALAFGGADGIAVQTDFAVTQDDDPHGCLGGIQLEEGDQAWVSMSYLEGHEIGDWEYPDPDDFEDQLQSTIEFWKGWTELAEYDGEYRDSVVRSSLALKALADARTGAIVAAPTTSLPEHIGGERNWDYRYTWIRDAALHLDALFRLGYENEAEAFFRFLARTTAGTGSDLQVFYGADGEHLMSEIELSDLDGYRGSRPVRVGNGAVSQFQLDLYGEFIELAWRYHAHDGELDEEIVELLLDVAERLQERWEEPDKGIWEVRGDPEHFVSSKIFAWRGVDRLIAIAEDLDLDIDPERWTGLRDRMREVILENGVSEDDVFVRAFGDHQADASSLLGILLGIVDPGTRIARNTVDYVRARLEAEDGLIFRYRTSDGLPGDQGAFFLCCFWLVAALTEMHHREEAREIFEALLERTNDLGLLSEEIDPESGHLLGNFPQAISHSSLIDAALRLDEKAERPADETGIG